MARRVGAALVAGAIVAGLVAAGGGPAGAQTKRERLAVVAAFYPVAFVAEQVGGKRVAVANLTPAGTEPHDLELTTKQRDLIEDAALVLVMGSGFQPAVEKAAGARDSGTVSLLARLPIDGAGRKVADDHDDDHGDEKKATKKTAKDDHADESDEEGLDPHVWLDPTLMRAIVDEVEVALTRVDPAGKAAFAANADALRARLDALDGRYRAGLADCDRRLMVTAHDAFGYLAAAYGLEQEGISGLSPDEEPNPKRLAELTDLVKRKGVTTVFTEELVSPRIAQTLAREAGGLRTATLNPLEGLTARELERGDDYESVMDRNLARLRAALGCR